jgi:hypothetical protein
MFAGTRGSTHGERKESRPAEKASNNDILFNYPTCLAKKMYERCTPHRYMFIILYHECVDFMKRKKK